VRDLLRAPRKAMAKTTSPIKKQRIICTKRWLRVKKYHIAIGSLVLVACLFSFTLFYFCCEQQGGSGGGGGYS